MQVCPLYSGYFSFRRSRVPLDEGSDGILSLRFAVASFNFNYYSNINNVMASEKEQIAHVSNPFLNPIGFWQNYLINWIEASRGFYENAIKANEHWFKAVWDLWLRAVGIELKETAKVE